MGEASVTEPAVDFCLPSLGADMTDATIIAWNVAVGDEVRRGDILLAVETEKGDIDVETWVAGTVAEIRSQPGDRIPVGAVIATLAPSGAAPQPAPVAPPVQPEEPEPAEPAPVSAGPSPWIPTEEAAEPEQSRPSGAAAPEVSPQLVYWPAPGDQVARSEPAQVPADASSEAPSPDPIRAAIARRVSRSNRDIPHYHVLHEIDLARSRAWLDQHNEALPPADRVVMAALLVHATAAAARAVADLNGHWTDAGAVHRERVDVGIILRLRSGGIVTPVIAEADTLTVGETMSRLTDLTVRARNGRLRSADLAEPSITVTSLGDRGVRSVLGIIQPPQLALVGFGRPDVRPVVVDGEVCARPAVTASLAGDHRASDGLTGAKFLHAIDRTLQEHDHT